ncbi:hypothetical protein EV652_106236 [Kribbella steppae]|uniref:Uncharacterized protein n=1 Tax=Kribbella steppae TaxID=2512223 RepID=A0A4R2HGF1_9ACTN|nr:hypothetical protein [Kribbella steppae]TCO28251.1 hypothetical protein EV652_106236 [Kribbella steppae]
MGRLTTPVVTAPDSVSRARATIGIALGIVSPSAVPLRDGRVWLTSRQDVLPAHIVRAMEEQLSRRAADRASDERMLAEAVAVLGAEIARARGESPEAGATDALDRLLNTPGLDQSRRTEGQAMLRLALRLAAQESEDAAARLRSLPGETRVPVATEIVSASQRISQDAGLLSTSPQSGPTTSRTGRHRAQVGVRHRRQTLTREVPGTSLSASQSGLDARQSELAALAALTRLGEDDLGSSVTSRPAVDNQSGLAAIALSSGDRPQYFRVEVTPTVRGLAAQGKLNSGTATDPHVLRIKPGLPPHQYGQVWIHQLSLMAQEQQAARAGQSTGILRRLRSALSHERLNRRTNADLAVYRKLSTDWQAAREGHPTGPLGVAELERDIDGLAVAIARRSGTEPERPWANDSTYSPAAAVEGLAAERAIAAANPEPNSPGHLRRQVVEQIASLEAAVKDLKDKSDGKTTTAAAAVDLATSKEDLAAAEDQLQDRGAPERARRLRVEAVGAFGKARRHTEMADAYQQAANDAGQALAGYRTLLSQLDDPNYQPAQIADLAREAAEKTDAYQASLRQALPVDHLETGVPTDQQLNLPVDEINTMLADNRSGRQIANRDPVPVPGAQYRRLFSDGMVFTVGGDPDDDVSKVTQVRLRMKVRDLTEVTGLDYTVAEQMSGTLGEGGQSNSITSNHSSSVSYGVDLQPFMTLAPEGSAVRAASQVVSPRVDVTTGQTLSTTAGATAHGQLGWVDVFKGESVPYSWTGEFEIEVRNSPTAPWSPARTVAAGEQLTWVPSPYTVKAPTETVTLEQLGRGDECTDEFPRHTVTRISGLHSISDDIVTQVQEKKFGRLDRVGYDHISELITQDPYRLLGEAAKPGGLSRTIPVGGESEYELTLEVEPDWSTARLTGACTPEMGQEKVQVDFAGFNASRVSGTSLSGSATLAYPGRPLDPPQPVPGYMPSPTALDDVGSFTADLSPNVSAGRNVSRQGGQNLSTTAITPVVDRDMAPTQGVEVDLKVTATLRKLRDPEAETIVVTDTCQAKLRLTANRLLRAGAPAGKDVVLRDDDNDIRLDQRGRALLLGDAEPPTGPQTLPPWHGTGENQLRGPGKSLPEELEGADEARQQALTNLSKMGLVPPLDADFQPRWDDKLPPDPLRRAGELRRRAGQLANYDRVIQDVTDYRIVAGMNTACQSGLVVPLVDHRAGHAPKTRLFRLSTTQDFDDVTPAGTTPWRFIARLGISSRASQQTSGRSKSVPVSGGLGLSNGPGEGQQGLAGRLGLKLSRSAIGRSFNWSLGRRINRVTLNESTGEVDNLKQGIRITFAEMTDQGDSEPLADVRGSVVLPYDSSLTRAEAPVFEADPKTPHPDAVSQSIPVAVDAGDPADRLFKAVDAIRADTTGFLQLHTALSPESLVSNTEWLSGRYELPLVITPAPGSPAQALADGTLLPQEFKVVLRTKVVSQTFVAINDQNTANINFTMNDAGHSSGTSASGGVGAEVGGGSVDADKSALSGKLGVGRIGGTSQSTSTYQTTGEERLRVNDGVHYELIERHELVADVMQGDQVVQTVPLQDALVQKAMPEFSALELYGRDQFDLPLPIAADVAERYLTGKVDLNPRTAAGFVRRYKQEKAGVSTGLAAEHTDERLNAKVQDRAGLPASTAPTPEERLEDTLVRTQQLVETRRVVGLAEQYDASLASSQLYMLRVEGQDEDVDLIPQIHRQLDEVAPGLVAADPLLAPILEVDLSKDSYQGQLENMLGPRGYTTPIEVPVEGQAQSDVLLVTVKARFEGDATVDGGPGLSKAAAIGLVQKYNYVGRDRSTSHTTTYSGSAEIKHEDGTGGSLSGGAGTDRIRSVTAGSGEQNTRLDRTGDFDLTPVYRTIVFTTEVQRIHNAGTAAMAGVKWRLNQTVPAAQTTAAQPVELRAELTAFVPRSVVSDPPVAQAAEEFHPDHRAADMPVSAPVEAMLPHRKGATRADDLYNRLTGHLAQRRGFGPRGVAQFQTSIGTQLQPTAMQAKFSELISERGLRLEPMAGTGNGRTTFDVQVNARRLGWQLIGKAGPGQTGLVQRDQTQTKTSTVGNQLMPATVTGGAGGGIVSVSGSVGEQVKMQSNDAWGTRFETSAFRNSDIVVVRIPVLYDVTIDEVTDRGRGTPDTKDTTVLEDIAPAEFYVKMQYHEFLEGLRQMETGGDVSLDGGRLQAMPEKLGKPSLRMTEYAPDGSYQPYRPLLAALEKAKAERTTVILAVQDRDGKVKQLYRAFKDGRMQGVYDGGFATAFATLDRNLVLMAEDRVNLEELYNTSEPGGNFSTKVAAALEQKGVPTAMLKGLTHSTSQREPNPVPSHAAKATPGGAAAGRTISPTASGPSLTGP